ncbi:hypothetical protein [Rhizobium sp. CIAT894]|uniref:hypothetical protein n=1 Tax=Rhizobium sp. CIAT894 TaxID=2020312 RepID=UPI000A1E8218|nr:hypothetical protein [Rhizobium sp. CIAT894]
MAVDEVFQKYCTARRIAAFDPDSPYSNALHRLLSNHFEQQAAQIETEFPKISRLRFGFYECNRFGAAADLWEGTAVIRMSAAVPTMLANFFTACLSHDNGFLPPGRDILPRYAGTIGFNETTILADLFNHGQLIEHSSLNVMRVTALVLACCGFIFLHEFVHIRNGHVDLFQSQLGLLPMEEMKTVAAPKLSTLDFQTMEWDADNIAFILNTALAIRNMAGQELSFCDGEDLISMFHVYCVSLYLMFKLMELMEPKNIQARSHPHPVLRTLFLMEKLRVLAAPMGIDTLPMEFDVDVVGAGEATWALVLGFPLFDPSRVLTLMDEQAEYGPVILKHWITLRERLTPLNRGTSDLTRFLDE